jgi:hypothetical protein
MKIVIENTKFDFEIGCSLLKLKHEECPYEELKDKWDSIQPLTFGEIAEMENLEHRRVGILCMGIERLVKEVNPILLDTQTIEKVTNYIDTDGKLVTKKFSDTYELYEVKGENFGKPKNQWQRTMEDCHFVKFKDTSTDREYMIWVDLRSVYLTNKKKDDYSWYNKETCQVNSIQCIAWTIQTNVVKDNIEKIIRQGDCIFVKPKDNSEHLLSNVRHLTEQEYIEYLVSES